MDFAFLHNSEYLCLYFHEIQFTFKAKRLNLDIYGKFTWFYWKFTLPT